MSDIDRLLELQTVDTTIDQATRRRTRLPERTAHAEAVDSVAVTRAEIDRLRDETAATEAEISAGERSSAEIDLKVTRLEAQLRTVIAVREAEALQHEIATLRAQRSEHDDRELEALDRMDALLAAAEAAEASLPGLESNMAVAAERLAEAEAALDAGVESLRADRERMVAEVPAALLARYEQLRAAHDGVGVARLAGSRCEGCHLDLSRAEVEAVRAAPPEDAECPSCGRLLVSTRDAS